jgi:hypothetical protein
MRFVGFLLLVAGWAIVLSSIVLLPASIVRGAFVFAALGVEALGLGLAMRGHLSSGAVSGDSHE